jgi:hypothetical protein
MANKINSPQIMPLIESKGNRANEHQFISGRGSCLSTEENSSRDDRRAAAASRVEAVSACVYDIHRLLHFIPSGRIFIFTDNGS